jgi:large subunit ribosomal protein L18Ae
MGRYVEYQVIGRKLPTEADANPKLYRMRIFAPNEVCSVSNVCSTGRDYNRLKQVVAKSRFWYYLRQLKKVKKATGEIVSVNQVRRTLVSWKDNVSLLMRVYA